MEVQLNENKTISIRGKDAAEKIIIRDLMKKEKITISDKNENLGWVEIKFE